MLVEIMRIFVGDVEACAPDRVDMNVFEVFGYGHHAA